MTANAITHMMTDTREPAAVASPIGKSVAGKSLEVKYTPGTRTSATAMMLCMNDSPDFPQAQKYPLKLKCIPAKMQSKIYPRRYCPPAAMTAASGVNSPTMLSAMNWISMVTITPKPAAIITA